MTRKSMMGLVRQGKSKVRGSGFLVTWDVDSGDQSTTNRLKYFLFGRTTRVNGKAYDYTGLVWKEGVRYVAQSAVIVLPHRLPDIREFLARHGIDHDVESVAFR